MVEKISVVTDRVENLPSVERYLDNCTAMIYAGAERMMVECKHYTGRSRTNRISLGAPETAKISSVTSAIGLYTRIYPSVAQTAQSLLHVAEPSFFPFALCLSSCTLPGVLSCT